MALQATVYRFSVELSHVDRGVYRTLDVRLARHPSENERYLLTRLFAYCHLVDDESAVPLTGAADAPGPLELSRGGLSSPEEPALSQRTLDGRLLLWVEIGNVSVEKLHKASKASPRVVVMTQHDPAQLVDAVAGAKPKVHRVDEIEVYALAPQFLDDVAAHIGDRGCTLGVTISDGELYVIVDGRSLSTPLRRVALT